MKINQRHYGVLFTLAAAMFFGTGAIIIKLAYRIDISSWDFLTLQYICSCAMLLPIYYLNRWRSGGAPVPRKVLGRLALQGVVGSFGGSIFLFLGFQYVGAAVGTVLFYSYPAFVTLGAILFFKEKAGLSQYSCLAITFLGTILTIDFWTVSVANTPAQGVGLIMVSALCYTFFSLYGQRNLSDSSSLEITTFTQLFAFLACIIVKPPLFLLEGISYYALFLGFVMALFTSVCSYFLLLKGMSLIGASKASIISTFEIPFTIILALIILGERLAFWQFLGAALIVGSIIYLDLAENKTEPKGGGPDGIPEESPEGPCSGDKHHIILEDHEFEDDCHRMQYAKRGSNAGCP
ncbi:DMT family transporter [Candidatus Formimonas warabiya]|uniref:EamA domain-containing protein n=1 Tax=Formimonas warabiya TaxID=1761012 RepID=A0A3G1KTF8_FORW1|nr:DMT family transporter [Candidatus Formimonas warabiya]ATW25751.1 hypothetical protein DCMF_14145 [Candidatus Formimonas warabiya]